MKSLGFYVYLHLRLDTNTPFYVGKGSGNRLASKQGRNVYWKRIVNKHGYKVKIILNNLPETTAFEKEIEFIKLYKDCGFKMANLTDGGEGSTGYNPTAETREKLRIINEGRLHTPETKAKIKEIKRVETLFTASKGDFVKSYTSVPDAIEDLGLKTRDVGNVWACLNNVAVTCMGYKFTRLGEEERVRKSQKHTIDYKRKKSKKLSFSVFEKEFFIGDFDYVCDAIEFLNLPRHARSGINSCLKGLNHTCLGYSFKLSPK